MANRRRGDMEMKIELKSNNLSYRLQSVTAIEYRKYLKEEEKQEKEKIERLKKQKTQNEQEIKNAQTELDKIKTRLEEQKEVPKTIRFFEDTLLGESVQKLVLVVKYPGIALGLTTQTLIELQKIKVEKSQNSKDANESDDTVTISTGEESEITFSLDYVTGIPMITGSSVKGRLRSLCETLLQLEKSKQASIDIECQTISDFLNMNASDIVLSTDEWQQFIDQVFGQKDDESQDVFLKNGNVQHDVFFDAFAEETNCLTNDYLTPHNPEGKKGDDYKNVIPVKFLRIKPGTRIHFRFKFNDFEINRGNERIQITAAQKIKFFKNLLMEYGIDAKTNKGYGVLDE